MTDCLRLILVCLALGMVGASAEEAALPLATQPRPTYHGVEGGRFEVIAAPGTDGRALFDLGERAWRLWRTPLGLPERWPIGITVRLEPTQPGGGRVVMEASGLTTVWLGAERAAGPNRDLAWLRPLSEALWRRKLHASGGSGRYPAWLSEGAARAVWVSLHPAMLDAWQHSLRELGGASSLREVLFWDGQGADDGRGVAAFALWQWLRTEGGERSWARFTQALGGGASPGAALAAEYGTLSAAPADAREWEMTWQVVTTRMGRARQGPMELPWRSRERIEALSRIAVRDLVFDRDVLLAAGGDWSTRNEPWLVAERRRRSTLLAAELGRTHVFWFNSAVSLGRVWEALAAGKPSAWREAMELWREDLVAALELQAAVEALLSREKEDGAGRLDVN